MANQYDNEDVEMRDVGPDDEQQGHPAYHNSGGTSAGGAGLLEVPGRQIDVDDDARSMHSVHSNQTQYTNYSDCAEPIEDTIPDDAMIFTTDAPAVTLQSLVKAVREQLSDLSQQTFATYSLDTAAKVPHEEDIASKLASIRDLLRIPSLDPTNPGLATDELRTTKAAIDFMAHSMSDAE
jgi:hypothetical protein